MLIGSKEIIWIVSFACDVSSFGFSVEQFLSVARLVRPDTEQTMKIEVAPWIKDYVTDMDDLYTDLKLTKLQNNVTTNKYRVPLEMLQ